MGISGKKVSIHMDTFPFSFPVRLRRHTVITAVGTVPVVELMPPDLLAGSEISLFLCAAANRAFFLFSRSCRNCG